MTREQIIEGMARAIRPTAYESDRMGTANLRSFATIEASAALTALEQAIPGLADVIEGKSVVVPREPTPWLVECGVETLMKAGNGAHHELIVTEVWRCMITAYQIDRLVDSGAIRAASPVSGKGE